MHFVWLVLAWLLAVLFGLLTISMLLMGNTTQAIPLLAIVLLLLPPIRSLVEQVTGRSIPGQPST